jgi:hypothetical protein
MSPLDVHKVCGHAFDKGYVAVVGRYADCSVFNCPGCGVLIDDRPGFHLRPAESPGPVRDVRKSRRTVESIERRAAYRRLLNQARRAGLTDYGIAVVVTALGANPSLDDLAAALENVADEQITEPRTLPGSEALRGSGPDSVAA